LSKIGKKSKVLKAYRNIQLNKRDKPVSIVSANETRMDRWVEEVEAYNLARDDIEDSYQENLGTNKKYLEDSDGEKEEEKFPVDDLLPDTHEQWNGLLAKSLD
jgi:hypothetical protein